MNLNNIRQIGKIFNSHGVKGEVKVASYTSYPEIYSKLDQVILIKKNKKEVYKVINTRPVKDHWLFTFEGVKNMDQAKDLKDFGIYVSEDELIPLAEDEFLISDLIDAKVYSTENEYLGKVFNYFENGEHGICEVKRETGKIFLFPTTKEVLIDIDANNKITINILPELLELND